jgi:hypothetical protein
MSDTEREVAIKALVHVAKALAAQYYLVTGKPLGVTGEVAEVEAAEKLGLRLAVARTAYFDAYRETADHVERFQIKGRAVDPQDRYRGRTPAIKCDGDYDQVLLVLLDRTTYDVLEIWQASRTKVASRLEAPGSRSRNERKSMGISQFKSIADQLWPAEPPPKVIAKADDGHSSADRTARSTLRQGAPIGSLITELLLKPELDYAQIVWRVKQAFPDAKTSTKSVATTARDLRRSGVALPSRIAAIG